jgi:hypothetical protein
MRTLAEALAQFAYRPATAETARRHSAVRDVLSGTVEQLWDLVPDGPEKTLMLRELQAAGAVAHLAIALTAPADTGPTRSVARQLPCKTGGRGHDELPVKVAGWAAAGEEIIAITLSGDDLRLPPAEPEPQPLGGLPPAEGCGHCQIPCGAC